MADTWVFRTSAEECLKVPCPACDAAGGLGCLRQDGTPRSGFHQERHQWAWRRNNAKPLMSRKEWEVRQRLAAEGRRTRGNLGNVRRDGW